MIYYEYPDGSCKYVDPEDAEDAPEDEDAPDEEESEDD